MRSPLPAVDDRCVGRLGILSVVFALLLVARCADADVSQSLAALPVVGPIVSPSATVASPVKSTPAPAAAPAADVKAWFAADIKDPYNATLWKSVDDTLAGAGSRDGWTAFCRLVSTAAGQDRAAAPDLGALACSKDGTVTALQRFAVHVLQLRAAVALYVKGAPGASSFGIQARQGIVRLDCAVDVVARQGGPDSPFGSACAKALDVAYLSGDVSATFTALGEAYHASAAEIARLAPAIDTEPGWFDPKSK
jgi:hypothetical protein